MTVLKIRQKFDSDKLEEKAEQLSVIETVISTALMAAVGRNQLPATGHETHCAPDNFPHRFLIPFEL